MGKSISWAADKIEAAKNSGSLGVNGCFRLGECYDGTYYGLQGHNLVLFEDMKPELQNTLRAEIAGRQQQLVTGKRIHVRITHIYPSAAMLAEVVSEK